LLSESSSGGGGALLAETAIRALLAEDAKAFEAIEVFEGSGRRLEGVDGKIDDATACVADRVVMRLDVGIEAHRA
jgi:hypothetical protein